jgi:hypothetical protein
LSGRNQALKVEGVNQILPAFFASARVLKQGLDVLGIETVARMRLG